jgi:hypothetical protein
VSRVHQDAEDATAPAIGGQKVYFVDVVLVTPKNPRQIDTVRADFVGDIPKSMQNLLQQVALLSRVIVRVFDDPSQRLALFEQLHKAADLGLRGSKYSVESASRDLIEVKASVVDAFAGVRDKIWRRNLEFVVIAAVVAVPGFFLFYAAQRNLWNVPQVQTDPTRPALALFHPAVAAALALLWIPLGAAVGVFLEFTYSVDREMSFEHLLGINPGRWRPGQQLLNTIFTSYCFAAIMGSGAFQIGVLSVLLNEFASTKPLLSFAVGFVTGFAFPYVRDLIFKFRPVQRA